MRGDPKIESLRVVTYRVPTDSAEADGTLTWSATEIVVVFVRAGGDQGMGVSYTAANAAASLIKEQLEPSLIGESAFDLPSLWQRMNCRLRNSGRVGLSAMAIAAVDQALWDLKAKLLACPLIDLWGKTRERVRIYGSGCFINYTEHQVQDQVERWLSQGLDAVKIKLGMDVHKDAQRVKQVRASLGGNVALMVDANGAYHPRAALELMELMAPHDVCWFEEPVSSDDLQGLRWLRDRAPAGMAIAAGEYGWDCRYFNTMLAAGAVDVLQVDATRCGYTGFLQAATLCEAWEFPLSAHCAPAIQATVCAAAPRFLHLEYFHDHVRLESMLFDGTPQLHAGELIPNDNRPGSGLILREGVAEDFRI